jgi:hypothetical protein
MYQNLHEYVDSAFAFASVIFFCVYLRALVIFSSFYTQYFFLCVFARTCNL